MKTPTTPCQACEKLRRLIRDSLICHCSHACEYVCRRCEALALPCSCGTEDLLCLLAEPEPAPTMKEIALELDSGNMPQQSRRDLFVAAIAARDVVQYLRANVGMSADWPLSIITDDPEIAEGLAAKLSSLERLLPK